MDQTFDFSDRFRKDFLPFFVESIQRANQLAPNKWGVTPYSSNHIRLNAGFCELITADENQIEVLVNQHLALDCEAVKSGLVALESNRDGGDYYASAPGSRKITLMAGEHVQNVLAQLRPAHDEHIRTAISGGFNRGSKSGHQDWAVKAIANELNLTLPLPVYSASDERIVKSESDNWTKDELAASVEAYLDMKRKSLSGEPLNKKDYYRELSKRFGRTEKSFEYRMQNISYVLSLQGRDWVSGLKPARNVGIRVAAQIEDILAEIENRPPSPVVTFEAQVQAEREKRNLAKPSGVLQPKSVNRSATQFERDHRVVAWVLNESKGVCDCCKNPAPFQSADGTPFLEVHHVRQLADLGSDTVENAVALCPNCHRELHHGANSKKLVEQLYATIPRLVRP